MYFTGKKAGSNYLKLKLSAFENLIKIGAEPANK